MARQTFKIEGLAELDEALTELPKATARNVMARVLKEQGQPIRDTGERLAPRRKGGLKASYTIGTKLSRRQKSLNRKESDVEVYIGPGPAAKSVQTEFGNAHQAAHPHLRPAFDGNVMKVLNGIKDSLAVEIEKARARLAKKAAKLAAKIAAGL
ncbi:HK97 gp10 family phage protein [Bradyrhizobium sp. LA6.1]|uniref:HK97-gp10 family putative phage morphogenesis protein n=1 Tax=Bradyrhizobium sp. LA6.1 TaxID=3156378 RepID=UPI00339810BB